MPLLTFDTSVLIAYQPAIPRTGFVLSAVVIQEMTAGAPDKSAVQRWKATFQYFEKEGRLLVPTAEDWWQSGKVLNSILRDLKSKAGGKTPRLPDAKKHSIIRDVLIAVTARRAGAVLITNHLDDFKSIRRFCAVKVRSGADYFRKQAH